jgi:hypothetical protein
VPGAQQKTPWITEPPLGPGTTLKLPEIGITIAVDDLYERVTFTSSCARMAVHIMPRRGPDARIARTAARIADMPAPR